MLSSLSAYAQGHNERMQEGQGSSILAGREHCKVKCTVITY
jgi:hypothetical protein